MTRCIADTTTLLERTPRVLRARLLGLPRSGPIRPIPPMAGARAMSSGT